MLSGIFTPMITIFKEDGSIDLKKNKKLLDSLIEKKVDGIVLLGSIGEFFNLSLKEKKDYLKSMAEYANNRTLLIAGTGSDNLTETIDLTNHAKLHNYFASLIISPYFFNFNQDQIYYFYSEVAKNTTSNIILYNFPDRTGSVLSTELVLNLATNFKNIIGIKDSTNSFYNTRKYITDVKAHLDNFCVFSGYDEYLVNNLLSGGNGIIGGLSNIYPEIFKETYEAFFDKNFAVLEKNQVIINNLMKLYDISSPFILTIKKATPIKNLNYKMRNLDTTLSIEQEEKIDSILKNYLNKK